MGENGDIYGVAESEGVGKAVKLKGDVYDTDEDGLLDVWETRGLWVEGQFLDLPAMGADPKHKDIFVEADYMTGMQPKPEAMSKVVEAFKNAPVHNPDKVDGITMHIDSGADRVMDPDTGALWGTLSRSARIGFVPTLGSVDALGNYNWSGFDSFKKFNFDSIRQSVFHYCLFINKIGNMGTTSGYSKGIPDSDFIVSLGGWDVKGGTELEQAGTFMHELGHNLGLRHGGPEATQDDTIRKPNYLSVMNYSFQTTGLLKSTPAGIGIGGFLDYSRFADIADLNENALNETLGVSVTGFSDISAFRTVYRVGHTYFESTFMDRIDWNNDGMLNIALVKADVGGSDKAFEPNIFTTLKSYEDWPYLIYRAGSVGVSGSAAGAEDVDHSDVELTSEEDALVPKSYSVSVEAPADSGQDGGASFEVVFAIGNHGEQDDTYTISLDSTLGWVDATGFPMDLPVAAGASAQVHVSIDVPAAAMHGMADTLTLSATSQSGMLVRDSDSVVTVCKPAGVGIETDITKDNYPTELYVRPNVDADGDWVIWEQYDSNLYYPQTSNQVFGYNVVTGETHQFTTALPGNQNPTLSGTRIAYQSNRYPVEGITNYDIFVYDISTGVETRITTDTQNQTQPRIDGNKVVYVGKETYRQEIHVFDLDTMTDTRITDITGMQSSIYNDYPDVSGNQVLYISNITFTPKFYVYDTVARTTRCLDGATSVTEARIDRGRIAWRSADGIQVYDLSNDTVTDLSPVESFQGNPSIAGNLVAYEDNRDGDLNIYLCNLDTLKESRITFDVQYQERPALSSDGSRVVYLDDRHRGGERDWRYFKVYMTVLENPAKITLTVDPADPLADGWYGVQPQITLNLDTAGTLFYQWDGTAEGSWTSYSNPFLAPEGEHTLNFYSVDLFGKIGAVESRTFQTDTTPPATVLTGTPSLDSVLSDTLKVVPTLSLSTGETGGRTYYQWDATDSGGWTEYSGPFTGLTGDHTIHYYSTDAHGNEEAVQQRRLFVDTSSDSTAPTTLLVTDPTKPASGITSTGAKSFATGAAIRPLVVSILWPESPLIHLTADEKALTVYRWDAQPSLDLHDVALPLPSRVGDPMVYGPDTSGATRYQGAFLAPTGTHTLYYYSIDPSGNREAMKSRIFIVGPLNVAPVADGQNLDTNEDTPKGGTLVASDSDGGTLVYSIVTPPEHGIVHLDDSATGAFTYSPSADYNGPDEFTFKVNDGTEDSNTATVSIAVVPIYDPPAVEVETPKNQPLSGQFPTEDEQGDPLSYDLGNPPAHGQADVDEDGSWTYAPDAGYIGRDTFTVIVDDGIAQTSFVVSVLMKDNPSTGDEDVSGYFIFLAAYLALTVLVLARKRRRGTYQTRRGTAGSHSATNRRACS